jgi:hypothetical protein
MSTKVIEDSTAQALNARGLSRQRIGNIFRQ